jgi:beta-glucosidase
MQRTRPNTGKKIMHFRIAVQVLLPVALALSSMAQASAVSDAEQRATALVEKMTLDEKLSQLINSAPAIPRLGIPAYEWWSEALHGAVSASETTNYPEPIGLAATFDDQLLHDVASAISEEVRAIHDVSRAEGRTGSFAVGNGLDVWAPNINIFRDPRWGRGQETYGEDPFLTARMGVAFVRGMQGADPNAPNVIATPKHFAVHSGPESTRHTADVSVSVHDLEDTYLPAFRAAIVDGHAGSIMCAYNSVNGQPACANDFLLKTKLRGDWGFKGYVVSDCEALKDISHGHKFVADDAAAVAAAVKTGVDNECTHDFGRSVPTKRYADAISKGVLSEIDVDRALVRLFAARFAFGDLAPDGRAAISNKAPQLNAGAHSPLALKTADESIVLLKNDGVLPIRDAHAKIVVTGPLADSTRVLRGNYSSTNVPAPVSVLAGLRTQFPKAAIRYVPAGPSYTDGNPISASALFTADGRRGVSVAWDPTKALGSGASMAPGGSGRATTPSLNAVIDNFNDPKGPTCTLCKAVYTGALVPPETGTYRLGLTGFSGELTFDGKPLVKLKGFPASSPGELQTVHLEKDHRYPFQVELLRIPFVGTEFVWQRVSDDPAAELREAAKDADVIVVVVGLTSDLEGEDSKLTLPGFSGGDRTTLDLPADQQQLLEAAKAMGKKLVVVSMSGSALNLTWAKENANAILQAWYPGEAGGFAVARVLDGTVNPAGRLPVTFYRSVADLPPFENYAMEGRTYRYFKGTPVYPFGYGLSYTTFAYGPAEVNRGSEAEGVTVRTKLANTGARDGDEVAQLYLEFPDNPGVPRLALRGFERVHLAAGKTKNLEFHLSPRDLSSVSENGERRVLAGQYRVNVGGGQPGTEASSVSASFQLDRTTDLPK